MLKYRVAYAIIFFTNLCIFIANNSAIPLVFGAVMLTIPLVSLVRIIFFIKTLSVRCSLRESVEAGQKSGIEVEINAAMSIMVGEVFFVCKKENKMFREKTEACVFTKISRGKNKIVIPFENEACGRVVVKIESLQCYDIFRLFRARTELDFEREIAVYPRHISCNVLLSKSFSVEREGRVYDLYKKGNDASEIIDIRKYQYGDSMKNIHWKLSSKLGSLLVREFSSPNDLNVLIFCDVSLHQNGIAVNKTDISTSLSLATAISLSLTEQGIGHGVCLMCSKTSAVQGIENMTEHAQMVNRMIDLTLETDSFDSAEAFVSLDLGRGYSKIIYITKEYNPEVVRLMARGTDFTVVATNNTGISTFESREDYSIASLDSDRLYSGVNNLSL